MSLDAKLEASKQCVKKTKCDIPALENIYDLYFMRSVFKLYFLFIIGEKTSKMRVNQLVLSVFVCPPYSCFTELFSGAFPGLSDTPEWSWLIFSCIVLCYKIWLKHFDWLYGNKYSISVDGNPMVFQQTNAKREEP